MIVQSTRTVVLLPLLVTNASVGLTPVIVSGLVWATTASGRVNATARQSRSRNAFRLATRAKSDAASRATAMEARRPDRELAGTGCSPVWEVGRGVGLPKATTGPAAAFYNPLNIILLAPRIQRAISAARSRRLQIGANGRERGKSGVAGGICALGEAASTSAGSSSCVPRAERHGRFPAQLDLSARGLSRALPSRRSFLPDDRGASPAPPP